MPFEALSRTEPIQNNTTEMQCQANFAIFLNFFCIFVFDNFKGVYTPSPPFFRAFQKKLDSAAALLYYYNMFIRRAEEHVRAQKKVRIYA